MGVSIWCRLRTTGTDRQVRHALFSINGHLRQEVDFGGNLVFQGRLALAWQPERSRATDRLPLLQRQKQSVRVFRRLPATSRHWYLAELLRRQSIYPVQRMPIRMTACDNGWQTIGCSGVSFGKRFRALAPFFPVAVRCRVLWQATWGLGTVPGGYWKLGQGPGRSRITS